MNGSLDAVNVRHFGEVGFNRRFSRSSCSNGIPSRIHLGDAAVPMDLPHVGEEVRERGPGNRRGNTTRYPIERRAAVDVLYTVSRPR
jgi:hypothetical protein